MIQMPALLLSSRQLFNRPYRVLTDDGKTSVISLETEDIGRLLGISDEPVWVIIYMGQMS